MGMRKTDKLRCYLLFFVCGVSCFCYLSLSINFRLTCKEAVSKFQHLTVTDYLLGNLLKWCSSVAINANDNQFNITYIQKNVRNFYCSQTKKYLTVPRSLTALASFPGSGNTWTRELIETLTGIHTGSIYPDWNFVGSKLCPTLGKVFIIKTHRQDGSSKHAACAKMAVTHLNYRQAIFILRNPYDALVAEFNRKYVKSNETSIFFNRGDGLASQDDFKSTKWDTFLLINSKVWRDMALYWLQTFDKPVHVIVYERLRQYTILEMYNLTKFLDIQIAFKSLFCLSSNTTGNYHRIKATWMTTENLFAGRHRILINKKITRVYKEVGIQRHLAETLLSYILPLPV